MRNQSHFEFVYRSEVTVVGHLPTSNSPYPFRWIEFGRIRRQENPHQTLLVLDEEIFQNACSVIFGIVQDEVYLPLSRLEKITEKVAKGLAVEGGSLFGQKRSCFYIDGPEESHLLAGGSRIHTRLLPLGGPGPYQTAVPLEMDLVFAPELSFRIVQPFVEVFLKTSCLRGSAS